MLLRLEREPELSVSELARHLPIKLPTVLKHLKMLSDAGLVRREKRGRTVRISLTPEPLRAATDWLARYERFWSSQPRSAGRGRRGPRTGERSGRGRGGGAAARSEVTSLTLVRHIRARPATVFDLLSTAEGLTSWWGPDDLPVLSAEADVRVGGAFRVRFRRFDGAEHECVGEFLEIVPPDAPRHELAMVRGRRARGAGPGFPGRAACPPRWRPAPS